MSEHVPPRPVVWGQILAIARHRVAEARSRRVFWIILLAALLAFAAVPFLPTDETPQGKLRLTIVVSLATIEAAALMVTILLSGLALTGEIESKTVYVLESKPVRRSVRVLGTYLGLLAVTAILLAVMGLLAYLFVRATAWREEARWRAAPTADGSPAGPPLDLGREVLRSRREYGPEWEQEQDETKRRVLVPPDGSYSWGFRVPPGSRDEPVHTFRLRAHAGLHLHYTVKVEARNPETGESDSWDVALAAGRTADIPVERKYVAGDGTIDLVLHNTTPPDETTRIRLLTHRPPRVSGSMMLAIGGDPFALSLAKALVMIFFKMAFLSAVTLAAATVLSLPVACMVGGVTAFAGYTMSIVQEAFQGAARMSERLAQDPGEMGALDTLVQTLSTKLNLVLSVPFPNFDHYSVAGNFTDGLQIPWTLVGTGFLFLFLARGGICVIIGMLVYSRREVGT